jgi:hypothetical protein
MAGQHLTTENTGRGTLAHEEKNKVRGIAPELETRANAFECHHGWGAPGAVKRFAAATGQDAAAEAATQAEGELQDRRQNDDALGLVENALGKLSGALRISCITFPEFATRSCSLSCATAGRTSAKTRQIPSSTFFMIRSRIVPCSCFSQRCSSVRLAIP